MKPQLSVSPKSRDRYDFNCRIALQLYSIYKAETVVKKEPRIPSNHLKRPAPSSKHHLTLSSYLKQQITSYIYAIRTPGNDLRHTPASLLRN
jgi:hypothetical protein